MVGVQMNGLITTFNRVLLHSGIDARGLVAVGVTVNDNAQH